MRRSRLFAASASVVGLLSVAACTSPPSGPSEPATTFAVVGDFGYDHPYINELGDLVDRLDPDYVLTTGDNVQTPLPVTGPARYDLVVGKHFCEFMADVVPGPNCPSGGDSPTNRFFPTPGNHDYDQGTIVNYLAYFNLPGAGIQTTSTSGSELYYDARLGPVHAFILDSEPAYQERYLAPAQQAQTNAQKAWLQQALAASDAPWKVVLLHEPPYGSSATYGSETYVQWPYAQWGADLVLNGHAAVYERVHRDGIVYVTNGLGGGTPSAFGTPIQGSVTRFNEDVATATRIRATNSRLTLELVTVEDEIKDSVTLTN
jgi:hypothetical protein